MKHPLGGDWIPYKEAKRILGWKLPFVFMGMMLFIVFCYLLGGMAHLIKSRDSEVKPND